MRRLSGRKTCDQLIRKGRVFNGKYMIVRWQLGIPIVRKGSRVLPAGVYVGTACSSRTSPSAVERNRMRRRCREALRIALQSGTNIPSIQLFITPRKGSLHAPFADIQVDIGNLFSTISTWRSK